MAGISAPHACRTGSPFASPFADADPVGRRANLAWARRQSTWQDQPDASRSMNSLTQASRSRLNCRPLKGMTDQPSASTARSWDASLSWSV